MKTLYIAVFFLLSLNIYAQENKNSEQQDNIEHIKKSKEFEAKMMKEAQENASKKPITGLASEQGLEIKEKQKTTQSTENNSGKLLPNTATMEEVLATIPGRQSQKNKVAKNTNDNIPKLPNTATLEEIKKTIPKN